MKTRSILAITMALTSLSATAHASEWMLRKVPAEGDPVKAHVAEIRLENETRLTMICNGARTYAALFVPAAVRDVAIPQGAELTLKFSNDRDGTTTAKARNAEVQNGTSVVSVSNEDAEAIRSLFSGANATIDVAMMAGSETLVNETFSAKGSTATLNQFMESCKGL